MEAPTPIEEVDRKTVAELERVIHALHSARMTAVAAAAAVRALWNATSGVVPDETGKLIASAAKQLDEAVSKNNRPDTSRTMFGAGRCYLIERRGGLVTMKIVGDIGEMIKVYPAPESEVHPEKWAAARMNEITDKLTLTGVRQL